MRRDYVTFETRHVEQGREGTPTVVLTIDAPGSASPGRVLDERLETADGSQIEADELDVSVRLQTPPDADDASGVFGVTNRLTGEFILEANVDADPVFDLVRAARDDEESDDCCYRIEIVRESSETVRFDKRTLLVYDEDGSLLRNRSLIPSGVEL